MAPNTLSILKPSVNNLSTRIFVRAAGLDFEEVDVWGKKSTPEFLGKDPADLTPLLEEDGLPNGSLWESCAIMQYLCNKHGLERFYPTDPARRAMVDSAMFYVIGTLYPYITRATYPTLHFPQYAGEVGASDADADAKGRLSPPRRKQSRSLSKHSARSSSRTRDSSAETRRRSQTSASQRRSSSSARSTTRFRRGRRSTCPRSRAALGDAYSEPAADVRGYVASVKPEAVGA